MIVKIGIMSEGDQVLNCWDDKIAIRRANGDVDIFRITVNNNVPTLSKDIWRITHGNNTIRIESPEITNIVSPNPKVPVTSSARPPLSPIESRDDADFEITIRPKRG